MSLPELLLGAWLIMAAVMLVLWFIQTRTLNAGTVDVAWAFGSGAVGVWFALGGMGGSDARQWLVAAMAAFWGMRLGVFLFKRVMSETEDGRYRYLREYLGEKAQPFYFAFFQVQATWTLLFALPMWAAAVTPGAALAWTDFLGLAIYATAMLGERAADNQLAAFRAEPVNKGKVCDVGLWRYSRHPNYFFEWLHWFAYAAIAATSPYWWVALIGPVVVYVFVVYITGVPYTEQQSTRTRGDAYREYQRTTSMFFPWPPKAGPPNAAEEPR
jgi:steroid 5-alpha reductase family enzyme